MVSYTPTPFQLNMQVDTIITELKARANPEAIQGMARYGINPTNNLGITIYQLRQMARMIGVNHALALQLWGTGIHDARLLACFIDDPAAVTSEQMDSWAQDFDSWDICDQACTSLFDSSPLARTKIFEWAKRDEEFVRRGAFALIAGLSVHDKQASDRDFECFFPLIGKYAIDERNFVKKAVNWALRNMGKRNLPLNHKAITLSHDLLQQNSKTARWIARDALRELTSEKIQSKLHKK